jgi:hypothetical protein
MYGYEEYVHLTPEQVLQKVTQEEIFDWIIKEYKMGESFDFKKRYKSPFRKHSTGRGTCRFEQRDDGAIIFVDFGDIKTHRTCFGMLQDLHGGLSLNQVVTLICEHFGLSTDSRDYKRPVISGAPVNKDSNSHTEIKPDPSPITKKDRLYWSQFIIKPEHLVEDNVYPTKRFSIRNHKGYRIVNLYGLAYVFDFVDKFKIYQPYSVDFRWITNCDENCIGNIDNLPSTGDELIIQKSYKDHRVLRNLSLGLNVIWFQNEGMIPSMEILINLVSRFKLITIFFDNDESGIKAALKLFEILESIKPGCSRIVHLPIWISRTTYKDPGHLVSKEGRKETIQVIKQIGIYGNGH